MSPMLPATAPTVGQSILFRNRLVNVLMLGLVGDDPATTRYYGGVARTLDQSRHSLLFGTVRDSGRVQERVASYGHRTFCLECRSTRDYPRTILRLARMIRDERIDIIHGNEELPSFLSGLAGIVAGRGIRIYHRQHDVSASYQFEGSKGRRACGATRGATEVRQLLERRPHRRRRRPRRLHAHGGAPDERLAGAPAVGPQDDRRAARHRRAHRLARVPETRRGDSRELGLNPQDPVVTIVARLNWRKGHDVLFEAVGPTWTRQPRSGSARRGLWPSRGGPARPGGSAGPEARRSSSASTRMSGPTTWQDR